MKLENLDLDQLVHLCAVPFDILNESYKPAVTAMHGPHSVFDIGQCTVIHCDARGVSLIDQ